MNPFVLFEQWFSEEMRLNTLALPKACCLSTIGLDGFPNARFVSLKEILNESFVITGSLNSRKGQEIKQCPNVALSFWWTFTERQIRIQGRALKMEDSQVNKYFEQRNQASKIVSSIFDQGKKIQSINHLNIQFESQKVQFKNKEIPPPQNWGGYYIQPIRIEFMVFKKNRLHERRLFEQIGDEWEMSILQP